MQINLFESLEKAGLIKKGKIHIDSALSIQFSKLLDLLDAISSDFVKPAEEFRPSIHTHCASLGMGGTRDECSALGCRQKDLNELARFAALYSDKVFIHNFLANHTPSWGHPPEEDSLDFRRDLIEDIQLLLFIRSLLETNKIVLFTPPATTCPYCYAKELFGSKADKRLQHAISSLSRDLYKQMVVEFYADEFGYGAKYNTESGLFRHQTHVRAFEELPTPVSSKLELIEQLQRGQSVTLSRKLKHELALHKELADDVLNSLRYQMSVADIVGASFLTHRDVDVKVLSYISSDIELDQRNAIVMKHLGSIVPFVGDVPISKLLRLRQREEEAFLSFRLALDTMLKEVTMQKGSLTERDAQSLYADVIAPELATLDRKVKEAKRDLVKTPLVTAVSAAAMITFGVYSGMVPAELSQIASALGLAKIAYDTVNKAGELLDVEKSIRPERFYFLWKVKHLTKQSYGYRRLI